MEVVTERLLHEERKLKERVGPERSREGAMTGSKDQKERDPSAITVENLATSGGTVTGQEEE